VYAKQEKPSTGGSRVISRAGLVIIRGATLLNALWPHFKVNPEVTKSHRSH